MTSFIRVRRILIRLLSWMLNKKASGIPALYLKQHKKCRRCYRRFPAQPLLTRRELTQLSQTGFQAQPGGFNITMDNGAPVITVSPNDLQPVIQCLIKRHGFLALRPAHLVSAVNVLPRLRH